MDDASQAREQDMLIRETGTGTVLSSADVGLIIGLRVKLTRGECDMPCMHKHV